MIADTRKMRDLKNAIAELMEKERYVSDMLTGFVEGGFIVGEDEVDKFIKVANYPEFKDMVVHLNKEDIMDNAYLKDIHVPKTEIGGIALGRKRALPAYTLTSYDERKRDLDTFEPINSFFICDRPLRFPSITGKSDSVCWMSVEPIEINSFKSFVDAAEGNVCLCGCGLGYVAYMLSLKPEVKSITIVELNQDVIDVFTTTILPQFKEPNKIKVVKSDALDYLEDNDLNQFDCINVDIWRDTLDMLPIYLQCLAIESAYPDVEFSYWLEPTLKDVLRKNILEQFSGYENPSRTIESFIKQIAKDILDNSEINTRADLKAVLELDDMRDVLYHWYITHPQLFAEYKKITDAENDKTFKFLNGFNARQKKLLDREKRIDYSTDISSFFK